MRYFVGSGKKARKHFHLKEIQTGLDLVSVRTGIFWGGGVIQEASLWLTLARGMKLKRWKVFQMDYLVEYFSFHLISHSGSLWHRISLKLETLDSSARIVQAIYSLSYCPISKRTKFHY